MDTNAAFKNCSLCPRACGIDRTRYEGACMASDRIKIARAALHMWEEPCISGEEGSGAVFFSGCSLGCVYCQNRSIATARHGKEISPERLVQIYLELEKQGANNINLVTAGHYIPWIVKTVEQARESGLSVPIVYNTSGYEKTEAIAALCGTVDVFLPDFKYIRFDTAAKYSRAGDYPETAKAALSQMVRQAGEPSFDERGIMKSGVVVRHLVLPGHVSEAKQIIKYLYETYGDSIYISIMNQYTPMPGIEKQYPELKRKLLKREYDEVVDYAIDLGVENGFIQEGDTAKDSFIPDFDMTGVD